MKEAPVLIWMNLWIKAYDTVYGCCSLLFSLILDQAPGPHPTFLKQHSSFFFSFPSLTHLKSQTKSWIRLWATWLSSIQTWVNWKMEGWNGSSNLMYKSWISAKKHSYYITLRQPLQTLLISQNDPFTPHSLSLKLDIFYLLKHYALQLFFFKSPASFVSSCSYNKSFQL